MCCLWCIIKLDDWLWWISNLAKCQTFPHSSFYLARDTLMLTFTYPFIWKANLLHPSIDLLASKLVPTRNIRIFSKSVIGNHSVVAFLGENPTIVCTDTIGKGCQPFAFDPAGHKLLHKTSRIVCIVYRLKMTTTIVWFSEKVTIEQSMCIHNWVCCNGAWNPMPARTPRIQVTGDGWCGRMGTATISWGKLHPASSTIPNNCWKQLQERSRYHDSMVDKDYFWRSA